MFRRGVIKALRWVLVVAVGLALSAQAGEARARRRTARPRVTALVGFPSGELGEPSLKYVDIVGGYVAGRGWIGSDAAKGLMHSGSRLRVYHRVRGRVGSATVTDAGALGPGRKTGAFPAGLSHAARVRLPADLARVSSLQPIIALWHAPGTLEPRWVPARNVSPKNRAYRQVVVRWLRRQGVTGADLKGMQIREVLQADIDSDGRRETFLSFDWRDAPVDSRLGSEAYLLLHYGSSGSRRSRNVLVLEEPGGYLLLMGLCDLDRDGRAEFVIDHGQGDRWETDLYYQTPRGLRHVEGAVGGL